MLVSDSIEVVIYNTNSEMRILDNGVLHVIYSDGIVLEIEDIKELQVQFDLLDPKPRKVLQHLGRYSTMSSDCRKYAAEHSPDLDGVAYVIHGLAQRLFIRFYVKMWKRDKPAKVFETVPDALNWLDEL